MNDVHVAVDNKMSSAKRRKLAALICALLVLILAFGSTLAWNNYRQHKTNEADADAIFYKVRLIDEYDATKAKNWKVTDPAIDKKVSVKNPGAETADDDRVYGDVYVRIQLKEFMEFYPVTQTYSTYRYMIDADGVFLSFTTQALAQAYADDVATTFGSGPHTVEQVRMYNTPATIADADLPWYIRTSAGDPNGVYGDFIVTQEDVDRANGRSLVTGVVNARSDQATQHLDDINTATAVGSTATNNGECLYTPHLWSAGLFEFQPSPVSIPDENFFSYIQWVYGADVILYSDWVAAGSEPVRKWIVDDSTSNTQGWVYWGYPLAAGEQTANFLEQIQLIAQPDDAFYYAIHVDLQSVSYSELGRWKTAADASGNNDIVEALLLAGMKVTAMTIGPPTITEVYFGFTQQFQATVLGSVGISQEVEWSVTGSSGGSFISESGLLTVGTNETSASITIKATSKVDPTKSVSTTLSVVAKPTVTGVTITSPVAPVSVPKGGVQAFSATVAGVNITDKVTWAVAGNNSADTTINAHGVLTVSLNETASSVRVIATSVDKDASGSAVSSEVTVTVP